jgi:hypothetical protein
MGAKMWITSKSSKSRYNTVVSPHRTEGIRREMSGGEMI